MKKTLLIGFVISVLFLANSVFAQQKVFQPTTVKKALYSDVIPSLLAMPVITGLPEMSDEDKDEDVNNELNLHAARHLTRNSFNLAKDPVLQGAVRDNTRVPLAPVQNFDGISNTYGVYPPDTQGDVGPSNYVQVVNLGFQIFSKTGTSLYGPANLSTIWAGIPAPWNGTNNGDPIVLYDQAADRWMIAQFSLPNSSQYAMLIAVSLTSNPTGAWSRYVFQFGTKMPDYPKFGVWPDGYYMAVNQFVGGSTWGGVGACAFERSKMLTGDPAARMVYFDLGATSDPGGMLPADWDGATAPVLNEPNYFTYFNDWSSATDLMKIWQFHVDWTTTTNSTFAEASSLATAPFDSEVCTSGNCVAQSGSAVLLEALTDRLMYRLQYRNFGDHQSMVTNHTVDVDGTGRAGVRWYELRNSGSGWSIYQQGTYSPDATNRWMASVAMNGSGDIALGYSASSSSIFPSIRYTGRLASDPLGQMTFAEQTIIDGTGYQSGSAARWGDYSMMSVDPTDDHSFWYSTEYIQTSGTVNWKTRIASFMFGAVAPTAQFSAGIVKPCLNTTTLFTDLSSGAPASWAWSVSPANYVYMDGTTSTSQNPHIKFTALGNYTIALTATNSSGSNTMTKAAYISVNAANADFSASSTTIVVNHSTTFTDASTCGITSWSWNFGADASPATANTPGPHVVTYSTVGQKTITLTVNGSVSETKTNYLTVAAQAAYCTPAYTTGTTDGDYITLVQLGSINNATGASASPFYTYYSGLSTSLLQGSAQTITLSPGTYTSGNNISVWIDYNQNGTFESTEKLGNVVIAPTPATGSIAFTVPADALTGSTRMRVREVYGNSVFDPCLSYGYGETEDYNVTILSASKILNLTMILEGLYNGVTMNKAQNASGDQYSGTVADQVTVELHNATTPYALAGGPYTANVNTNNTSVVTIPSSLSASYYIVINHRNSIETWSSAPVSFASGTVSYNFTTAASKAYGNNLKAVAGGLYAIYGGNATGSADQKIDGSDLSAVDNGSTALLKGYVIADVTGDGKVDGSDMALVDNNSTSLVARIKP